MAHDVTFPSIVRLLASRCATRAHIQVLLGTTVTWTDLDSVHHSVVLFPVVISTADTGKSGVLSPGQSFSYTFTSRGIFEYSCSEHPGMFGTVVVT